MNPAGCCVALRHSLCYLTGMLRVLFFVLFIFVTAPQALAQNKMRRLSGKEKQALKEFNNKKSGKSASGKTKKGGFLFFKKKEKTGYDRAVSQQEKGVQRRMRKNKRKAYKW